jgi:hypothetical protein
MKLLLLIVGIIILVLVFALVVFGAAWATPVHLIALMSLGLALCFLSTVPAIK